jgi:hypothetical protein
MFRNRILSAIALSLSIAFAQQASAQSPVVPKYTGNNLLFPDGFRTWIFVGSNIGLAYKEELQQMALRVAKQADKPLFHNIYINPEAYAHFRDTGEFPDPTMFVMDMFRHEGTTARRHQRQLRRRLDGQPGRGQEFGTSAGPERRENDLGLLHLHRRSSPSDTADGIGARARRCRVRNLSQGART